MAYGQLRTANTEGFRPGFAGYADLWTPPTSGWPYLRGCDSCMGDIGPVQFSIGPDGQWSAAAGSQPNTASIADDLTRWLGGSTVLAGVPNSLVLIGAGLALVALKKKHR